MNEEVERALEVIDACVARGPVTSRIPPEVEERARHEFEHRSEAITGHMWDWEASDDATRNTFRLGAALSLLSVSEKRAEELDQLISGLRATERGHAMKVITLAAERNSSQASLLRVEAVLKPFADCADAFKEHTSDASPLFLLNGDDMEELEIELGDLRKARTALSPHKET